MEWREYNLGQKKCFSAQKVASSTADKQTVTGREACFRVLYLNEFIVEPVFQKIMLRLRKYHFYPSKYAYTNINKMKNTWEIGSESHFEDEARHNFFFQIKLSKPNVNGMSCLSHKSKVQNTIMHAWHGDRCRQCFATKVLSLRGTQNPKSEFECNRWRAPSVRTMAASDVCHPSRIRNTWIAIPANTTNVDLIHALSARYEITNLGWRLGTEYRSRTQMI